MKYVARFSTFDSLLVSQGDLLTLREGRVLVHGANGLDWQESTCPEILEIAKNLTLLSQNGDGTFWTVVSLDSETGSVEKTGLYRYFNSCSGGYDHAKAIK